MLRAVCGSVACGSLVGVYINQHYVIDLWKNHTARAQKAARIRAVLRTSGVQQHLARLEFVDRIRINHDDADVAEVIDEMEREYPWKDRFYWWQPWTQEMVAAAPLTDVSWISLHPLSGMASFPPFSRIAAQHIPHVLFGGLVVSLVPFPITTSAVVLAGVTYFAAVLGSGHAVGATYRWTLGSCGLRSPYEAWFVDTFVEQ
jgi:hypothetical protein